MGWTYFTHILKIIMNVKFNQNFLLNDTKSTKSVTTWVKARFKTSKSSTKELTRSKDFGDIAFSKFYVDWRVRALLEKIIKISRHYFAHHRLQVIFQKISSIKGKLITSVSWENGMKSFGIIFYLQLWWYLLVKWQFPDLYRDVRIFYERCYKLLQNCRSLSIFSQFHT